MRNIALIGFRTTGKSTVGELLAQGLGWSFLDMDEHLTASFGQQIDGWVRAHGWESFRAAEAELLGALTRRRQLVVATGGGIVLSAVNRELLRSHYFAIWLQASPETIYSRLVHDPKTASQRPPLTDLSWREEIEHLLLEREALYAESAALKLATDTSSASEITARILLFLEQGSGTCGAHCEG